MRYLLFSFYLLVALPLLSSAQDTVIQYRTFSSELKTKSQKTPEDKYFNYITMRLEAGDGLLIIYKSRDYVTELVVQDSIGTSSKTDDNGISFSSSGSKIIFPFQSMTQMLYYIAFSSKEKDKTGKYDVRMVHYNHIIDMINDASPFCDKLYSIIRHAQFNFEFIKKGEVQNNFNTTLSLFPGKESLIKKGKTPAYTCMALKTTDKTEADKALRSTDSLITTCLKGYEKTTTASVEPEIRYRLEGNDENDINTNHAFVNIKAEVFLRMHKAGSMYFVELVID
jgi:hypothetical protein